MNEPRFNKTNGDKRIMAKICLKEGSPFWGKVIDYDWKDKFLVVEVYVAQRKERRITHWDNIQSVFQHPEEGGIE